MWVVRGIGERTMRPGATGGASGARESGHGHVVRQENDAGHVAGGGGFGRQMHGRG